MRIKKNGLSTALALAALLAVPCAARAAVPAGFTDTLVTSVGLPTSLAFTPDGRLLITEKGGALRIFQGGELLATPAITLAGVCADSERGLLGVAVDPAFASNGFVYLFYTFDLPGGTPCAIGTGTNVVNRVSRFTLSGNTVSPASELVLIDNMPSPNGNHNAGDVQFGPDGFLYVTIGDGGCDHAGNSGCAGSNDAARDLHVLTGKVLRITAAGGIPASNPFQGPGTARCNTGPTTPGTICQEIFATGLRNPFRIAFDPNDAGTRFFINDVGQDNREEIDVGQAGGDYGWNCREGSLVNSTSGQCSPAPPGLIPPIFEYARNTNVPGTSSSGCRSITGGAFVPDGLWPGFDGIYLWSDFACGSIFRLTQSGGTFAAADFATGLGANSVITLRFGPDGGTQALYYTTLAGGGQVRKIRLEPLDFHTVAPCRAVDTRLPPGPLGGPAIGGGMTRTFVLAGTCSVPATARAVALNVTAVAPGGTGHLTVFPGGTPVPGVATLNFSGRTRSNNGIFGLGAGGDVGVQVVLPAGQATHVLIDVVGFFE